MEVLLMRMLVHDKTALGLQGKRYCAPHNLHAITVNEPACHGELQVLRTLVAIVDQNVLVTLQHRYFSKLA